MKIDMATMEVLNHHGDRIADEPKIHLDGGDEGLDVSIRHDRGHTVAEIRYEPKDPDRAAKWGNDSDFVLLDWFLIHDAVVTLHGGRLTIVGYMAGAKGFRRNGEAQYQDSLTDSTSTRGNAYTDDGGPLVRVRWTLV